MSMNESNSNYTNETIKQLKGADRVRLRPSVIFGSDGLEGCQHSIFEIISNSIDEAKEGFGTKIEIFRHADGAVTVKDYGRGIPVDYNANEKRFNWELVFCELYAGGKYDNLSGKTYKFSLGLNGLGLCSTQYASEFMDVEIVRDGYKYDLHFEKGENIGGLKKEPADSKKTYSKITWKPDREVFTDINVPLAYYQEILRRQSIVTAGLVFVLYDEQTKQQYKFCYENGIRDYLAELASDRPLTEIKYLTHETSGRDREDKAEYDLEFEIAFCFDNEVNLIEYYHNSSWLEHGGAPDKALRAAFSSSIDAYIRSSGLYKKDEKRLTFADIEDSLIYVCNSFSVDPSYENQTKKSITNSFIQEAMTEFIKKQLEVYFIESKTDADKIANQVLANKRSRETAEKTRVALRKKLTGGMDFTNRVEKYVDCRSKKVEERELYIVEGDSALGACKLGRDPEFQAIMPVRGKILNCLKADYNKIFANEIITNLLKVLGCGIEIKTKQHKDNTLNSFDLDKLNFNKVIICTDADVDGFQIRTLILTMLYRLTPSLITANKVFIAESPLYEITSAKKTYFAYSDKEKNDITAKLTGKYTIQRSKGLGENEPEMMWETTMSPETRKLIQVMPGDAEAARDMFELMLGENLKGRKNFIEQFGHKYIDMSELG